MLRQLFFLSLILMGAACQLLAADTVSIQFSDKPAGDALQELAQKAVVTILVESSVKGKVTVSANDVSSESALSAICQSLDVQWRRLHVYQKPGEELKADNLAAVVRIISAARLPDIVVSEPGSEKPLIFFKKTKPAATPDQIVKDTGMKLIYLVSNDRAAAKKAEEVAKPDDKSKEKTAAERYAEKQAEMLTDFLAMTPEERPEAIRQSMEMMTQMDPRIMQEMMQASTRMMMEMPPDKLAEMIQRQMQMAQEMMRNPEVLKKIQEAVAGAVAGQPH